MDIPQKILLVYSWDFFFFFKILLHFLFLFLEALFHVGALGHGLSGLWVQPGLRVLGPGYFR